MSNEDEDDCADFPVSDCTIFLAELSHFAYASGNPDLCTACAASVSVMLSQPTTSLSPAFIE